MKKKNPKNKQTKFAIVWGENSKLIRGGPPKNTAPMLCYTSELPPHLLCTDRLT